jgi:hypothetical protein
MGSQAFKLWVTYVSRQLLLKRRMEVDVIFLVLTCSKRTKWWDLSSTPFQYSAVNLESGERFEFNLDSILAENSKEL